MKKLVYSIVFALVLVTLSCGPARFDRLPGIELTEIPTLFHGEFLVNNPTLKLFTGTDSSTVQINANNVIIKNNGSEMVKSLKQDFVITMLDKIYILGFPDANLPTLWNIIILEPNTNGFWAYPLLDNNFNDNSGGIYATFTSNIVNLEHQPIVAQPPVNGVAVVAAPTPSPKQGFPSSIRYFNMNEEQLIYFFNNNLKNKSYISFSKPGSSNEKSGAGNKKQKAK